MIEWISNMELSYRVFKARAFFACFIWNRWQATGGKNSPLGSFPRAFGSWFNTCHCLQSSSQKGIRDQMFEQNNIGSPRNIFEVLFLKLFYWG